MSEDINIRRHRRVLWICVVVFTLPFLFLAYQRMHGINMLKAKLHDLKQAGEEIDYRLLVRSQPPASSNAAVALTNLFPRIDLIDNLLRSRPPAAESAPDHRRRPFLQLDEWDYTFWVKDDTVKRTNDWATFVEEFSYHTNLLREAISALDRPEFLSDYDPDDGFVNLRTEFMMGCRDVEKLLASGFSFHVKHGDRKAADRCLVALLKLSAGIRNDGLIISKLVSQGVFYTARTLIWQALQIEGWTDEQLRGWSDALAALDFDEGMINAYRLERALTYEHFERLSGRAGNERQRKQAWDMAWSDMERNAVNEFVYVPMWSLVWREQDYCLNLDSWNAIINHLRSTKEAGWIAVKNHSPMNSLPYEPIRFDAPPDTWWNSHRYLFGVSVFLAGETLVGRKTAATLAQQRLAQTAIAIRRYQLRHGKPPAELNSLMPDFLAAVPQDPMNLQPLRYRFKGDEWKLHSIGEDGVDDSGDNQPIKPGNLNAAEIDRKDIVWPPAFKP